MLTKFVQVYLLVIINRSSSLHMRFMEMNGDPSRGFSYTLARIPPPPTTTKIHEVSVNSTFSNGENSRLSFYPVVNN